MKVVVFGEWVKSKTGPAEKLPAHSTEDFMPKSLPLDRWENEGGELSPPEPKAPKPQDAPRRRASDLKPKRLLRDKPS